MDQFIASSVRRLLSLTFDLEAKYDPTHKLQQLSHLGDDLLRRGTVKKLGLAGKICADSR